MRRSGWLAIFVIIVLIIGAVIAINHKSSSTNNPVSVQNGQSNKTSSNQNPSTGTINIRNMMFTPSQITVAKGGTVTWTNNDSTTHTVEADLSNNDGPASGDIPPGGSYSFTFNKTGSFQYHCSIHPSMRGTIVVK